MMRLDSLVACDYAENAGIAANECGFLLTELTRAFLDRLHEAWKGKIQHEELKRFAECCVANNCCCTTFNHDDFLDEALDETQNWSPDRGTGSSASRHRKSLPVSSRRRWALRTCC